MNVVASFHDYLTAQRLVIYLREHGIPASVSGEMLDVVTTFGGILNGQYQVSVDWKQHVAHAKSLARVFRTEKVSLPEDWEENARPDLSLLDDVYLPTCPMCSHQFMKVPANGSCSACHNPVDFVALILDRHGPEALESCYADEPIDPEFDHDAVCALDLPCLRCGYSLKGLEIAGQCPVCGHAYDKVAGTG